MYIHNFQDPTKRREEQTKFGVYFDDDYNYLQHLKNANEVYCLEGVEERYRIDTNGCRIDAGKDILPSNSTTTQSKVITLLNYSGSSDEQKKLILGKA